MDNKFEALSFARQLEVDRFVRKLAYCGSADSAGFNFWYDWMDGETHVIVRASTAGTDSASVEIVNGAMLYHATDYGRNINIYRHGQWIHRLRELADQEYNEAHRREAEKAAEREATEAAKFAPIDF